MLRCRSAEALASSVQAVGSDVTLLVLGIHRLVALVSRNLHLVVLDDVLLDDSLSRAKCARLIDCLRVEVCLGDETIVAWNMSCCLRCTNSQIMVLISLLFAVLGQLSARVMTMGTYRHLELSMKVSTLASVRLTGV